MPDDITPNGLPADAGADGAAAAASAGAIKEAIGKTLGKDFPDDATALKAVKDTFAFVSDAAATSKAVKSIMEKKGVDRPTALRLLNDIAEQLPGQAPNGAQQPDELKMVKREVEDLKFYKKNPDLESYKDTLDELRDATGKSLEEILSSEKFKKVLDKAQAVDRQEATKSVLRSSPRLGAAKSKMDQARDAQKAGQDTSARAHAVGAVLDAFGMKGEGN